MLHATTRCVVRVKSDRPAERDAAGNDRSVVTDAAPGSTTTCAGTCTKKCGCSGAAAPGDATPSGSAARDYQRMLSTVFCTDWKDFWNIAFSDSSSATS